MHSKVTDVLVAVIVCAADMARCSEVANNVRLLFYVYTYALIGRTDAVHDNQPPSTIADLLPSLAPSDYVATAKDWTTLPDIYLVPTSKAKAALANGGANVRLAEESNRISFDRGNGPFLRLMSGVFRSIVARHDDVKMNDDEDPFDVMRELMALDVSPAAAASSAQAVDIQYQQDPRKKPPGSGPTCNEVGQDEESDQ